MFPTPPTDVTSLTPDNAVAVMISGSSAGPSDNTPTSDYSQSEEFSIPDEMDIVDTPTGPKCQIKLFGLGCLDCSYLVEGAGSKFDRCHHTRGNTLCPAKSIVMVEVGERTRALNRALAAQKAGDTNTLLKLIADLQTKPVEVRTHVLKGLGLMPS